MQDYDNRQPRISSTLPINYKLQQQPSVSTPADDIPAENITGNITQRKTVHSPVEEQNQLEETTAVQKRGINSTNVVPATSISNTFEVPDGIRRMTMNTPTGIPDMSYNIQQFNVDKQQNASRISDLCEVPIPWFDEDLAPTENNNRQRLPCQTNQLPNISKKLKPHKEIIHKGQRFVQFGDGQKFSVYFLEVNFMRILFIRPFSNLCLIFSSRSYSIKFNNFL